MGGQAKKVLNLYSGLGGNRKLWEDVNVTAIELNPAIAKIYQDFFLDDTVIVTDAHQYLLEHYDEGWDFIWSSPPCPSHSQVRNLAGVGSGQSKPIYPEMGLYEEIIFLQQIFQRELFYGRYVVENVVSYYPPLIKPKLCGRHYYWSNFPIKKLKTEKTMVQDSIKELSEITGFDLSGYKISNKYRLKLLRNCVCPKLGKHIFDCAFKFEQQKIFSEADR